MPRYVYLSATALSVFAFVALTTAGPSSALTAKECSVKYKAAKSGGTLNGLTWNEFRKQECEGAAPTKTATEKPTPPPATTNSSGAVFPSAVDAKFSKESAGKARFHTCLEQYHANKANGGNGGLKWITKGGGYYSQCNKVLKG